MRKIFYNKETLEIKGMSDGDNSFDLPYVETDRGYHSTENLKIVLEEGEPTLTITKAILDKIN